MFQKSSLSLLILSMCLASAAAAAESGLVNATAVESLNPLAEPCFVTHPQAAVFDGGDRELWVWRESRPDTSRTRLRAAHVDARGEISSDFIGISRDASVSVLRYATDQAPDGDLWVAWGAVDADRDYSIRVRALGQFETGLEPETVIPSDRFLGIGARLVDIAAAPMGHALVAWIDQDPEENENRIVFRPLSASGEALEESRVARLLPGRSSIRGIALTALSDTEFLLVWSEAEKPNQGPWHLRARRLINVGSPDEPDFIGFQPFPIDDGTGPSIVTPEVVTLPDGGYAVAWIQNARPFVRLFDSDDDARGAALPLDPRNRHADGFQALGLAVDSRGRLVATWSARDLDVDFAQVVARRIDADGTPREEALTIRVADRHDREFRHVSPHLLDSGEVLVLWDKGGVDPGILLPPCTAVGKEIQSRRLLTTCGPDEGLCLRDQRFQVEVAWNDPRSGTSGVGAPLTLTSDTGLFWFFEPDNLELVTKVIDGRAVNGKFWFFYGALSNVGYEISVLDRLTGDVRRYENPPGNFASFGDTRAFPTDGFLGFDPDELEADSVTLDSLAFAAPTEDSPHLTPPLCGTTDTQLCLNEQFSVTVEWEDFRSGDSGVGETIPLTRDTGSFWFFDEDNVELVVKVLDARAVNGHFWVFYGSLTDVGFTLTVRDENDGAERIFVNPPGQMASDADVRAFE